MDGKFDWKDHGIKEGLTREEFEKAYLEDCINCQRDDCVCPQCLAQEWEQYYLCADVPWEQSLVRKAQDEMIASGEYEKVGDGRLVYSALRGRLEYQGKELGWQPAPAPEVEV